MTMMDADSFEPSTVAGHYLQHAFEHYDAGRFEAALQSCDKAVQWIPSLAEAYNLSGVVLEELGRSGEAADAYETAIELDPEFEDPRQNLRELAVGWAGRLTGDASALKRTVAQQTGQRDLEWSPEAEMAKLHLAEASRAYDEDRYDAALRSCHLALALDPGLAEAHNLRGLTLEELDRPAAAAAAYGQAFYLDPTLREAQENWKELEAELAWRRQPVTVATFLHPLQAHLARGRLEEAGIHSFLADEEIVALNYFWANGFHGIKLCVAEESAGEALDLLRSKREVGVHGLGDEDGQIWCPECLSYHTRYETYNLQLVYLASLLIILPFLIAKVILVLLLPLLFMLIPKRAWTCQSCGHAWNEVP
jgi:Flp pilus assembly protein TadD